MLFDSYVFIFCFLPMVLLGYYFFTRAKRFYFAISWLVLASLFFYGWWDPKYLILLLCSISINYFLGYLLWDRSRKRKKNDYYLFGGIALNLLFLGYFKYAYFFISNLNGLLASPIAFDPLILPLGISFFTFQKIAFLVDASRGEIEHYRFSDYCLFVTFFPQLIAGPIVQHNQIIPQLSDTKALRINAQNLSIGLTIFFIGLFKKIALADSIAPYANCVFDAAATGLSLTFCEAWAGAFAYALQLYFDFSGYSDMAIGLAYLFGIKLPLNFFSPYQAKNIIDFWRRWHMTLSRFLKDYLYISLGGNRKGPSRRYINLLLTMLLGGLWHGANWTFMFWGGLHGFYLVINHMWQALSRRGRFFEFIHKKWFGILSQLLTLLAVVLAWVPFRASNIQVAKSILKSMLSLTSFPFPYHIGLKYPALQKLANMVGIQTKGLFLNGLANWYIGLFWILALLIVALMMPNTSQLMNLSRSSAQQSQPSRWLTWQPNTLWASILAILILIVVMQLSQESEFLYFQF